MERFNPPPGWPTPPKGWLPPPGWKPNPQWPLSPPGWNFFVDSDGSPLLLSGTAPPRRPGFYTEGNGRLPMAIVTAKSPGMAAFFTLLWLGVGHLYAGSVGVGVALVLFDTLLFILSLTFVGLILTIPVWLVVTPVAMVFAARAASAFNTRNGIIVR